MVRAKASLGQLCDVNRLLQVHNDLCDTHHLCTHATSRRSSPVSVRLAGVSVNEAMPNQRI